MQGSALPNLIEQNYVKFSATLMPYISEGDVPLKIKQKIEDIHDQIAELYLLTMNDYPMVKTLKVPFILTETPNGKPAFN